MFNYEILCNNVEINTNIQEYKYDIFTYFLIFNKNINISQFMISNDFYIEMFVYTRPLIG